MLRKIRKRVSIIIKIDKNIIRRKSWVFSIKLKVL